MKKLKKKIKVRARTELSIMRSGLFKSFSPRKCYVGIPRSILGRRNHIVRFRPQVSFELAPFIARRAVSPHWLTAPSSSNGCRRQR